MKREYYELNQAHICRRLNLNGLKMKRFENYPYKDKGKLTSGTVYRWAQDIPVGKTGGYSILLLTKSDERKAVSKFFELVASGVRMNVSETKSLSLTPLPVNMEYMGEL